MDAKTCGDRCRKYMARNGVGYPQHVRDAIAKEQETRSPETLTIPGMEDSNWNLPDGGMQLTPPIPSQPATVDTAIDQIVKVAIAESGTSPPETTKPESSQIAEDLTVTPLALKKPRGKKTAIKKPRGKKTAIKKPRGKKENHNESS